MAARQSSRGRRATGGLMEECILIDQTLLNEIIIPRFWGLAAWAASENEVNAWKSGVGGSLLTEKSQELRAKLQKWRRCRDYGGWVYPLGRILPPLEAPRNS